MLIFLAVPLILDRYRLPGIVGIIVVGAVIGPHGLGLLERGETIRTLGEVGLIYLMFLAGLEINLSQFIEYKDRSIVFGVLSFLIPQVVGTAAGIVVLDLSFGAASLFAAIFSSHTLLAYPVVNRLGIAQNEAMTATIGGTIITDTLALLVLAVVIAAAADTIGPMFWLQLGVGLTVFFVGVWLIVPRLGRWFFRIHTEESYFEFLFVMAILFACAFLAELAGVEDIIGAFLAGLALNRLIPSHGTLMNRIEFVGNAFFIPFFLLSVGMLVNIWVLREGVETLVIATLLIVLVLLTKYAAAWMTGAVYDYTSTEVIGMFGLSMGQAAAALAIVQIGFQAEIGGFDENMINAVVLMILAVSLISPPLVERAGTALVRVRETVDIASARQSQRLLVPLSSDSTYATGLLDLAMVLRDPHGDETIHTVTVLPPGRTTETADRIGAAEHRHDELKTYVSAAEVALESHVRINHNVASGIVRSGFENRATTLVIGWDGARTRQQRTFGHTIDQVLVGSELLTVIGRVRAPLQTTRRMFLVCPPDIERNPGFPDALETARRLAEGTESPLMGRAFTGDPAQFETALTTSTQVTVTNFDRVESWERCYEWLESTVGPDDLIVCVSARRGTVGWSNELIDAPSRLTSLTAGNVVIIYPGTDRPDDDRQFIRFTRS